MKPFLGMLLKAYAALAGYAVAVVALIVLVLLGSGAITAERAHAAFEALRGRTPAPAAAAETKPSADLSERELILEKRTLELQKLEERAGARLSLIKAEQEALDRKRSEAESVVADSKRIQQDATSTKSDAELAANVPILSRMEPAGVVALLKDGDDARFVRHLRAMRPSKAAEVLEALRTDPQFEQEFRRVPSDAPAGTKPRVQRLNEEFQK